ncbi:MAG: hypothetical protein NXH97_22795 [Rhodobacteraceae bacterium]|nr:hypothetical protein [Paracoccaceae bacterium]
MRLLALALLLPTMAEAQVSDIQRCIWACLAGSPGNTSPEYHQCVSQRCTGEAASTQADPQSAPEVAPHPAPQPPAGWTMGPTTDGFGQFANLIATDNGLSFAYVCYPDGRSYFILDDRLDGPGGAMHLEIDGTRYFMPFARSPDWLTVTIAPGAPLFAALMQGRQARLLGTTGDLISTYALPGADRALGPVLRTCFG